MTKVKICGLKRKEDILTVNMLLPDYIGFVFAKSKRQVTLEEVDYLKSFLDPHIQAAGVFVNAPLDVITSLCSSAVIDMIQLHGDEDAEYANELRSRVHQPIVKAVRVETQEQIFKMQNFPCEYLLLDTFTKDQYGGSGHLFDHGLVPEMEKPFFLAGGLTADNVQGCIKKCRPYAVDVSSAVESDGQKDSKKIKEFIERVKNYE